MKKFAVFFSAFLLAYSTGGLAESYIEPVPTDHTPGPLQFGVTYSDALGTIFDSKWVNYINNRNAFAFELDYGANEFRIGGTWGIALTDQQRFKLTGEHLAQNYTFDFASGLDSQWEGQNAIAAAYQYLLLNSGLLHAFNASAYYTSAEDQTFDTIYFNNNLGPATDLRRVAGATTKGGSLGVQLQTQRALFNIDVNYDDTDFDPIYVSSDSSSGPGVSLGMQRLLGNRIKVGLINSFRQALNYHELNIKWLALTKPGKRLELILAGSNVNGDILTSSDNRATLTFAYSWGGDKSLPALNYSDTFGMDDLSTWTNAPAIHMPGVLAQQDELVQQQ